MIIKLAGLIIEVKNKYSYFNEFCQGFEAEGKPHFSVKVPDKVMKKLIIVKMRLQVFLVN